MFSTRRWQTANGKSRPTLRAKSQVPTRAPLAPLEIVNLGIPEVASAKVRQWS